MKKHFECLFLESMVRRNLSEPNGFFNFFLISVVQFKIIIVEFMSEKGYKENFYRILIHRFRRSSFSLTRKRVGKSAECLERVFRENCYCFFMQNAKLASIF
jgi:hypothetical protein